MRTLRELDTIKAACREARASATLGLVPTMGALHAGHLSLVHRARAECDQVAATIFVNPLQFGPGEDFESYPRQEQDDLEQLAAAGVDLALVLRREEMYPPGFATAITQADLTTRLEGASRPGHFDGVLTVVAKLLNIAGPCRAYFGRKDFQQTVVVRRLVADLDLPAEIVVADTVRDVDGLALSSRNVYLGADPRRRGLSLVAALQRAEELFEAGERSGEALERAMTAILTEGLGHAPDYAAVVGPEDLAPRPRADAGDVLLVAGRVDGTHLIDNHVLGANLGRFSPGS